VRGYGYQRNGEKEDWNEKNAKHSASWDQRCEQHDGETEQGYRSARGEHNSMFREYSDAVWNYKQAGKN